VLDEVAEGEVFMVVGTGTSRDVTGRYNTVTTVTTEKILKVVRG